MHHPAGQVAAAENDKLKADINGQFSTVVFDGTSRLRNKVWRRGPRPIRRTGISH
jgi:hypothetical protein